MAAILTWLLLTSASFAASPPEPANEAPAMFAARLDPIWTSLLTKDPAKPTPWPTSGFVPNSWAEASGGAPVLLGTMYSPRHAERLILHNAERVGPEGAVPLALPASEPPGLQRLPGLFFGHVKPNLDRGINSIALGTDGTIWLGGGINCTNAPMMRVDAMAQQPGRSSKRAPGSPDALLIWSSALYGCLLSR